MPIAPAGAGTSAQGLRIGSVLGATYRVERLVAAGGMGVVYEARHLRLDRRFAIKILQGYGEWDPALVQRLRYEATLVAQLEHPNVVQVFDIDETEDGVPYLVMEYLEGMTLAERLDRGGPPSIPESLRITSKVAAALTQVHARGIVHCDLKPGNVFLVRVQDEPDFIKVFDFGVSRGPKTAWSDVGAVAGTLRYMPPEQLRGARDLDGRTDQFALAAMFYEMVSGTPALTRDHILPALLDSQEEDPPPLSDRAPWVTPVFDAVLRRAMSKDRKARFPTISRFARELNGAATELGRAPGPDCRMPASQCRPHDGSRIREARVQRLNPLPRRPEAITRRERALCA